MKAWRVWLKNDSEFTPKWLVVAGESLSLNALMDDIAECGVVAGDFYRVRRQFGNSDGTNTHVLGFDKKRIIPMASISNIEEYANPDDVVIRYE